MSRWPMRMASEHSCAWAARARAQAVNFPRRAGSACAAAPAVIRANMAPRPTSPRAMRQSDQRVMRLESHTREQAQRRFARIGAKREAKPLVPLLVALECLAHRQIRGVARKPAVAPIDREARVERTPERANRRSIQRRLVRSSSALQTASPHRPAERKAARNLGEIDGQVSMRHVACGARTT